MGEDLELVAARAQALVARNRHRQAAQLLERALGEEPHDEELLDLLAQAQLELDPPRAVDTAGRLVAAAPDSHRGHLLASFALDRLGDQRGAVASARKAVELAPWLPVTHTQLAQALVGRRRSYGEARRAAARALELAPDDAAVYVTAGNVELGRGRSRRARRLYRRALELDPMLSAAHVNVALTDNVHGNLGSAFGGLQSVLALDPADEAARRVLDNVVYTALVHLLWVALVVSWAVAILRQAL